MGKVWEYQMVEVAIIEECERKMNEMGARGWELVAAMNHGVQFGVIALFFKRETFECV